MQHSASECQGSAENRSPSAAVVVVLVVSLCLMSLVWPGATAAEHAHQSIERRPDSVAAQGAARSDPAGAQLGWPSPPPGAYRPPVRGEVVDAFRMDNGPYGAGNRGLEYRTVPGSDVVAVAEGTVVFAGSVAGRLAVTVRHGDGRRSSVTRIRSIDVRRGDVVDQGQRLGTAGDRLHLGVREGDRYVDPAALFSVRRRRAVLIEPFVE